MSCGTNSSSPDYKVLHRAVPIAWPISFMEGDILKMQLISFYHGNENVTVVGKESLAGRQREPVFGCRGSPPCRLPGPQGICPLPPWLSAAGCHLWVRFGEESLRPLPQLGVPPGHPRRGGGWSWVAAQAEAQCHPVTACDLRGDSWGRAAAACSGFAAKILGPGSRSEGIPRQWRIRENPRHQPCCCFVMKVHKGRSSRTVTVRLERGFRVTGLVQVLTEAESKASWG